MGKPEEWQNMIEISKTKAKPSHYFAKLCRMVKDGTYQFVNKVKEVASHTALFLHDKLVKYNFGKYQKYWVKKANEFIEANSESGFIELLEYADKKQVSQKYLAKALLNGKPPRLYYQKHIMNR